MKFLTPLLVLSLAAFTAAQNATLITAPTTTYALTPQQSCLGTCIAGDVNCQAACVGAAHPNSVQVSLTNECAAKCIQGDGSVSQTNSYNLCLSACIANYYPTTQTVAPVAGVSSSVGTNKASATGSGSAASAGATVIGGSGTATGAATGAASGTATGTAAHATVSKAAAASAGPFVGGLGLFLAVLAL